MVLYKEKKIPSSVVQWQKTLNDVTITNDDIISSFKFAQSKTMHPKLHDKKIRLLHRKTHFNNQICKYDNSTPPYCLWCKNTNNVETPEDLLHALYHCPRLNKVPQNVLNNLGIAHLSKNPMCPKRVLLSDTDCIPGAKLFMDTIWLIYTCLILTNRLTCSPIYVDQISNSIKTEILTMNKCFPERELGKRTRSLNLDQFLASHEVGSNIHWTTFSTETKLDY